MVKKEENFGVVSYILGIISIVTAFLTSFGLGGIIFGIIGLVQSKKQKTDLSKKAKKLNTIGLILGIIMFVISLITTIILTIKGVSNLQNFPV